MKVFESESNFLEFPERLAENFSSHGENGWRGRGGGVREEKGSDRSGEGGRTTDSIVYAAHGNS